MVDLDALRELAWSGIPADLRPVCWQLLLGYLPPNRERRRCTFPLTGTHCMYHDFLSFSRNDFSYITSIPCVDLGSVDQNPWLSLLSHACRLRAQCPCITVP